MAISYIYNGGFEILRADGLFADGWDQGYGDGSTVYSVTTENVYDGTQAMKIVNPTFVANLVSVNQNPSVATAVTPGDKWEASAYFVTDVAAKPLRIVVNFFTGADVYISSLILKFTSTTTLQQYSGVVTVPATAAKATVDVGMHGTGTVWMDFVQFQRLYPVDATAAEANQSRFLPRQVTGITTVDAYSFLALVDVSENSMVTYVVTNTGGANSATVKLQISADGSTWIDDASETTVSLGATVAIVPRVFAQFARLAYRSTSAGLSTTLTVLTQIQFA